jgi:hypothetical protein
MRLRQHGTGVPILDHVKSLLNEADLRYQQRFDAQNTALDAARVSAKEGVTTALIAAEKAVTKAEVATENRLTLLNELRSGVATKEQMDALAERVSDLKDRVVTMETAKQTATEGRTERRSDMGLYILAASVLIAAIGLILAFRK